MLAWIDIAQVQYMVPFVDEALSGEGLDVLVTARDYGFMIELLRARGVPHRVIGGEFGVSPGGQGARDLVGAVRALLAILAHPSS